MFTNIFVFAINALSQPLNWFPWNPNIEPDLLVNFLLEAIKHYQTFIYQFPATKI
jgi:hypothetical protein